MKLSELIETINTLTKSPICQDPEVVIVVSDGGFPGTPSVKVKDISLGFDWDHGKLMLRPEQPLVRKETKQKSK